MSLIILEGVDRSGKSTAAEHFKSMGYELIHMSAPPKGQTEDLFLEEMIKIVSSAAHKDIVLDRSWYGETVWPFVFGRKSLLTEEGLTVLQELEESVGTTRILMWDPNAEANWARCVKYNEPLTKLQFMQARSYFQAMANKHKFQQKNIKDWPTATLTTSTNNYVETGTITMNPVVKTKEQLKLDTANAINDVLSKRILKKGDKYDVLENKIRSFLNDELAKIFSTKTEHPAGPFSAEEVELLKFFCGKLKEGK